MFFSFWSLHYLKELKHTICSSPFQSASKVINPLKKPFLLTPSLMSYKDFLFLFQSLYLRMRLLQWVFPSTFGISVYLFDYQAADAYWLWYEFVAEVEYTQGTWNECYLYNNSSVCHSLSPLYQALGLSFKLHRVRLCYWLLLLFLFSINKICVKCNTSHGWFYDVEVWTILSHNISLLIPCYQKNKMFFKSMKFGIHVPNYIALLFFPKFIDCQWKEKRI